MFYTDIDSIFEDLQELTRQVSSIFSARVFFVCYLSCFVSVFSDCDFPKSKRIVDFHLG